MSGVRCFVGLELPPDVVRLLSGACEALRRDAPTWRGEKWVADQNLHVTIAFIGSVADEAVSRLAGQIGDAVAGSRAFDLRFTRVRAVPGLHRCRMIWADFDDPDESCARLAERVLAAAEPFGAQRPERVFRAHVTLARARRPRALSAAAVQVADDIAHHMPGSMSVGSATLFASTLSSTGPHYEMIGSWPLHSR